MSSQSKIKKCEQSVPSDIFKVCPECDGTNLLRFDGEALCTWCDWNSISFTLDAIGIFAFSLSKVNRSSVTHVLDPSEAPFTETSKTA